MMQIPVEAQIKLNKFKPRPYQLPIMDAIVNKGYKRVLAILPRRAGKDVTAFNLCIRQCLEKICVVYYIFPTYSQAKKVIWDSVTNSGERILDYIPEEVVASMNSQEMKIRFVNGSLLQLVGSDNFDSLMGTNPYGVVFSEYALQDPRAFQYIRPILVANQGWALFISCVAPNTLVIGKNGLRRIKNISGIRSTYSDLNEPIYGLGGFHNAEQYYYGGKQKTFKITLESGFQLECTPIHPVWNGSEWIKAQDLKLGDLIPIQYGQEVWGQGPDMSGYNYDDHGHLKITQEGVFNRVNSDEDFWYLLGLIHADGNYDKNKITITNKKDRPLIMFLERQGFRTRSDGIHHELNSKAMCWFLEYIGFKHGALNKSFPDQLLGCKRWQLRSLLQGIFDGDGCSHKSRGTVKLTSGCHEFIKDIQILLLNFGIVSSVYREEKAPTKLVKVASTIYNLEINGVFAARFYGSIGFRLERKQFNRSMLKENSWDEPANVYPIDPAKLEGYPLPKSNITNPSRISRRALSKLNKDRSHPYLQELLKEKLFFSPIKSIELSENEVFDFVIPDTHSFFSNGFISHNTPRGKNHLWELYQIAINSDEWFAYKLTVEDTGHIPLSAIEKEKADGIMSEDLIMQEYYTSFDMGVEGSYYAKYLDRMRMKGQIGIVPWENGFKVHTAWDLGVRDNTTIIFFQTIGMTIRIIDCYSNSKQGLEHYIKVLESKPYQYGKHIAPHDIKVKEFGTGITRLEKAKQLGVQFTVSADVGIVDGIEAVRSTLGKVWIDEVNCKELIKALENYRQEFDVKRKVYKGNPLHDWSSHYADSMRYLCVSLPKTQDGTSAQELERRYQQAVYGSSPTTGFFRDDKGY